MLGVATLIIVMAVMNGFRSELITRILGINGHMIVQPIDGVLDDYAALSDKYRKIVGVTRCDPVDRRPDARFRQGRGRHRGTGQGHPGTDDLSRLKTVADNIQQGDLISFAAGDGVAIGSRMAENLGSFGRRHDHADSHPKAT